MPGPNCKLRATLKSPAVAICACGWHSEERPTQSAVEHLHHLHRHDLPGADPAFDRAEQALRDGGIGFEIVETTTRASTLRIALEVGRNRAK